MNGAHDLGGRWGLGAIDPEPEAQEPVFHAEWERRAFALTLATGMLGHWNIDEARYAREQQHPVSYLQNSYYENWLAGLEHLLAEKRLLEEDLLQKQGETENPGNNSRVPTPDAARKILFSGGPVLMDDQAPPRFQPGDKVRVKKIQSAGHTRAPGYTQGAVGVIADHFGTHVFPDRHSKGERHGEHLYSVVFAGKDLWGAESEDTEVRVDLWEPYLEHLAR